MPRTAFRWEVDLSPEERIALQAVEDYVRFGYQFASDTNANAIGFLMVIFPETGGFQHRCYPTVTSQAQGESPGHIGCR